MNQKSENWVTPSKLTRVWVLTSYKELLKTPFVVYFLSLRWKKDEKRLEKEKSLKTDKKVFQPTFGCTHLKAGQNTQQVILALAKDNRFKSILLYIL